MNKRFLVLALLTASVATTPVELNAAWWNPFSWWGRKTRVYSLVPFKDIPSNSSANQGGSFSGSDLSNVTKALHKNPSLMRTLFGAFKFWRWDFFGSQVRAAHKQVEQIQQQLATKQKKMEESNAAVIIQKMWGQHKQDKLEKENQDLTDQNKNQQVRIKEQDDFQGLQASQQSNINYNLRKQLTAVEKKNKNYANNYIPNEQARTRRLVEIQQEKQAGKKLAEGLVRRQARDAHVDQNKAIEDYRALQRRIAYGREIFMQMVAGSYNPPKTALYYSDAFTAFMNHLYNDAVNGFKPFDQGAFMVRDYNGELLKFLRHKVSHIYARGLEQSALYPRKASHFKKFIKFDHKKKLNSKNDFGISVGGFDIRDDDGKPDFTKLEINKSTALIIPVCNPSDETGVDIFIKPEGCGTNYDQIASHAASYFAAQVRKVPVVNKVTGTDQQQYYNKERIPTGDVTNFQSLALQVMAGSDPVVTKIDCQNIIIKHRYYALTQDSAKVDDDPKQKNAKSNVSKLAPVWGVSYMARMSDLFEKSVKERQGKIGEALMVLSHVENNSELNQNDSIHGSYEAEGVSLFEDLSDSELNCAKADELNQKHNSLGELLKKITIFNDDLKIRYGQNLARTNRFGDEHWISMSSNPELKKLKALRVSQACSMSNFIRDRLSGWNKKMIKQYKQYVPTEQQLKLSKAKPVEWHKKLTAVRALNDSYTGVGGISSVFRSVTQENTGLHGNAAKTANIIDYVAKHHESMKDTGGAEEVQKVAQSIHQSFLDMVFNPALIHARKIGLTVANKKHFIQILDKYENRSKAIGECRNLKNGDDVLRIEVLKATRDKVKENRYPYVCYDGQLDKLLSKEMDSYLLKEYSDVKEPFDEQPRMLKGRWQKWRGGNGSTSSGNIVLQIGNGRKK
jgi:hypothetical protein